MLHTVLFCKAIHVMKIERSLTFWKPLEMGRVGYTYARPWCELIKRIPWKHSASVHRCAAIMARLVGTHCSFVTIPWRGSRCRDCRFLFFSFSAGSFYRDSVHEPKRGRYFILEDNFYLISCLGGSFRNMDAYKFLTSTLIIVYICFMLLIFVDYFYINDLICASW